MNLPCCPNCGANFKINKNEVQYICQFCGTQIIFDEKDAQPANSEYDYNCENKTAPVQSKENKPAINNGFGATLITIILVLTLLSILLPAIMSVVNSSDHSQTTNVKSAPALKEIAITLPQTPVTVDYLGGSTSTVFTETIVNSITFEQKDLKASDGADDMRIKFILNCKKTDDWKGDKGTETSHVRLIIKNSAGEIIETKSLYKMTVSVNQIFDLDCEAVLNANDTYVIELDDYVI